MCYEPPIPIGSPRYEEFISRDPEVRRNRVCPLLTHITHLDIDIVPIEGPSSMGEYRIRFQLSRIWREVYASVEVYCGWLRTSGNHHDGSQPDPTLNIHVCISQRRPKVLSVDRRNIEQGDTRMGELRRGVYGETVGVHHRGRPHASHAGI